MNSRRACGPTHALRTSVGPFQLTAASTRPMHRFIPEPGSPAPSLNPEHTAAIKRWTRELLGLPADAVVSVHETACADTGCPLVETVVAVFDDSATRTWTFTRPRVAVTKLMLQQTLATPPARSSA